MVIFTFINFIIISLVINQTMMVKKLHFIMLYLVNLFQIDQQIYHLIILIILFILLTLAFLIKLIIMVMVITILITILIMVFILII